MRVVCDTSVWIDLAEGGVLDKALRPPAEMVVPDLLFDELRDPRGEDLVKRGLSVLELGPDEMMQLDRLTQQTRRLSLGDLAALLLAERTGFLLASRDRLLVALARERKVEVIGTASLVQRMEQEGLLKGREARQALARMRAAGRKV